MQSKAKFVTKPSRIL